MTEVVSPDPEVGVHGVVIEDVGDPDEYGRQTAEVHLDGVAVGTFQYADWPQHMVIYERAWSDDAPDDTEIRVVDALLDRFEGRAPPRITHAMITTMDVLRWYAASHLRSGLIVCGAYGWRTLFYDPLSVVDLSEEPEPAMEGMPAVNLTVMYVGGMEDHGQTAQPTLEDAYQWLIHGDPLGRFAAIRRLVVEPDVDPDVRTSALHLGLLNENTGVRQFCAIHLGGYFPELEIRADVPRLHALMADPLQIWSRFGRDRPDPSVGDDGQSRRNARYALAWTLGNVCWNANAWGAKPWAADEAEEVRALVQTEAETFDEARDAWLYERALADFDPAVRFGLGCAEPVGLLDFLRFVALRWQIIERLGLTADDRFYWMMTTSDGIIGRGPQGDPDWVPPSEVAALVHGPAPSDVLPEVSEMPGWMHGTNHYELYVPVELAE